jgi:hypothetical protein
MFIVALMFYLSSAYFINTGNQGQAAQMVIWTYYFILEGTIMYALMELMNRYGRLSVFRLLKKFKDNKSSRKINALMNRMPKWLRI